MEHISGDEEMNNDRLISEREIIERAKQFNEHIDSIDSLFEHIDKLSRCHICKKPFVNKICVECVEGKRWKRS
jgi:hypothetical protein